MIRYGIIFLIIALIAAFFGFGGASAMSMDAAYLLIGAGIIIAVLWFLLGRGGPGPVDPAI